MHGESKNIEPSNGISLSFDNGISFLKSAKVLLDNERYNHCFILTLFAAEELAKSNFHLDEKRGCRLFVYYENGKLEKREIQKINRCSVKGLHKLKIGMFLRYLWMSALTMDYFGSERHNKERLIVFKEKEIPTAEHMFYLKNNQMYVDVKKSGCVCPDNITKTEAAKWLDIVEHYSEWLKWEIDHPERDSYSEINADISRIENPPDP